MKMKTHAALSASALCALLATAPNAAAQCQVDTVESLIPSGVHGFGEALGLSADYMVSGAMFGDSRSYQVFRRIDGDYVPQDLIVSRLGTDLSTRSDFEGSTLVIGLGNSGFYGELDPNAPNPAGEVDLYDVSNPGGFVEVVLTPSDNISGQGFGGSVAVDDGVVVVGSQHLPGLTGPSEGAVYVFEKISGVWTETQKLEAAIPLPFNLFGGTVEIEGDRIAVGTSEFSITAFNDPLGLPPNGGNGLIAPLGNTDGRLEIFSKDATGQWQHRQVLDSTHYGWELDSTRFAMDGDHLFVAAIPVDLNLPGVLALGSVSMTILVLEWNEATQNYELEDTLIPTDRNGLDLFGESIEAEDGTLVVAAPMLNQTGTFANQGAAYVFHETEAGWTQTARLMPDGMALRQAAGSPITACGDTVIVGNIDGGFTGGGLTRSSYVFAVRGDCNSDGLIDACQIADDASLDINLNGRIDSCESGSARPFCSGGMNSTGQRAQIRSIGDASSLSATHGTFQLEATGATSSAPGLFFAGDRRASAPLGDGVRCVGGIRRLGAATTNASGVAQFTLDVDSAFGTAALSGTWHFQYIYRDGGTNWNLTNGLAVDFIP